MRIGETRGKAPASRRGRRLRFFKVGPDFLDPMIRERASGLAVYQLDLFMGGEAHCRQLLFDAAEDADLIVMGTHGLTGVEHLLFGSTAERVQRHAKCPVMTIRPETK